MGAEAAAITGTYSERAALVEQESRKRSTSFFLMPDDLPPPPSVRIRRCTIHAGRYRWDVIEGGRPIASALESFATKDEAEAAGVAELAKLALGTTDEK